MAFVVPAMPLDIRVYTGPWLTKAYRFTVEGNLAFGRRVTRWESQAFFDWWVILPMATVLVPADTDVRDLSVLAAYDSNRRYNDVLEVPEGSGRFFGVVGVDDVGKGFPNEHRFAECIRICPQNQAFTGEFAGSEWPIPIP